MKPAGASGIMLVGRAINEAPFSADRVANSSGTSAAVTLRIVPGFSFE